MLRLLLVICFLIASLYTCASDVVVLKPVLKNIEGLPAADVAAIVEDLNEHKCHDLNEVAERVRSIFLRYGYFKVQVADPIMPIEADAGQKKVIPVDVLVTAGKKYRLGEIGLPASSVFSTVELRAAFPITDGDILDTEKIGIGLENLRKLYAGRGYMFFSAVPETDVNDRAQTVSLRMDLDEGPIFYAGSLTVRGAESQRGARNKLLSTWKAYEGRVYDLQTLERFLRDLHARSGVRPEQVFEVSFDEKKHLANVYIYLARPLF